MTPLRRRWLWLGGAALLVAVLAGGRWLAMETAERAWAQTIGGAGAAQVYLEARALQRVMRFAVLALAALLIDRRALLVAGLAYLGAAIGFALTGARVGVQADGAFVVASTLVILGALVLTLGAGWVPLRRRLLALLSPAISSRLPPVPARP